eukprot:2807398-Ditylum_brightwellii.AAC.1
MDWWLITKDFMPLSCTLRRDSYSSRARATALPHWSHHIEQNLPASLLLSTSSRLCHNTPTSI